jgi:hypothetical protein
MTTEKSPTTMSHVIGVRSEPDPVRVEADRDPKVPGDEHSLSIEQAARLAFLARTFGFPWTAFCYLFVAAVGARDRDAGFRLAEVLIALRPTHALPELDEAFRLALCTPWARPTSLARVVVDYLLLDRRLERLVEDTTPPSEELDLAVERLAGNELFGALLQTAAVCDLRMERLLMMLRDHLLVVPPSKPGAMRLAALLATHANLIEYLWPYTSGPIDTRSVQSGATPPMTAARALLNSMFRPPGPEEIDAIESVAADPAVSCLLERVRDEPAVRARLRDEIERAALLLGTATTDREDAPRPCLRWFKEPCAPRRLPLPVHRKLRARRDPVGAVLVAGCGSGQDLFAVCATYPSARVAALDASAEKLAHAALRCQEIGLTKIDFVPGGLLDVLPLGWTFDVIECLGLERRAPDADFGCKTLARCSRPGSLLRLAVFSDATCRVVSALRHAALVNGVTNWLADLRAFRLELLEGRHGALPPGLLRSPDFFTASGLRELLFADEGSTLGTSAWRAILDVHGFEFICAEVNADLARSARAAGFPNTDVWSIRDSRRFEREDAFAFGGVQFLWFERRT